MAIILEEEGLMGKVRIYATDFNNESLQKAAEAVYRTEDMVASEANYKKPVARVVWQTTTMLRMARPGLTRHC